MVLEDLLAYSSGIRCYSWILHGWELTRIVSWLMVTSGGPFDIQVSEWERWATAVEVENNEGTEWVWEW